MAASQNDILRAILSQRQGRQQGSIARAVIQQLLAGSQQTQPLTGLDVAGRLALTAALAKKDRDAQRAEGDASQAAALQLFQPDIAQQPGQTVELGAVSEGNAPGVAPGQAPVNVNIPGRRTDRNEGIRNVAAQLPADVLSQLVLSRALAGPEQGEPFTLAEGAIRFGPDGQPIAENPKDIQQKIEDKTEQRKENGFVIFERVRRVDGQEKGREFISKTPDRLVTGTPADFDKVSARKLGESFGATFTAARNGQDILRLIDQQGAGVTFADSFARIVDAGMENIQAFGIGVLNSRKDGNAKVVINGQEQADNGQLLDPGRYDWDAITEGADPAFRQRVLADARLQAALVNFAYGVANANNPGGRISDADFENVRLRQLATSFRSTDQLRVAVQQTVLGTLNSVEGKFRFASPSEQRGILGRDAEFEDVIKERFGPNLLKTVLPEDARARFGIASGQTQGGDAIDRIIDRLTPEQIEDILRNP